MPWWAYAYIAFFLLLSIYGICDDLHKRDKVVKTRTWRDKVNRRIGQSNDDSGEDANEE